MGYAARMGKTISMNRMLVETQEDDRPLGTPNPRITSGVHCVFHSYISITSNSIFRSQSLLSYILQSLEEETVHVSIDSSQLLLYF